MKYFKITVLLSFLILLAILVFYFDVTEYVESGEIKFIITSYGPLAPFVYMMIYAVAIILFLPAAPFSLIGGAIFGPVLGTILITFGATIGALGAFLSARFIFRKAVQNLFEKYLLKIKEFDNKLEKNGFLTTIFLRLVIVVPFNVMNFILGLTKVGAKDFFFGTLIGIIPAAYVFAFAGHSVMNFSLQNVIISILMLSSMFIASLIYKNKFSNK